MRNSSVDYNMSLADTSILLAHFLLEERSMVPLLKQLGIVQLGPGCSSTRERPFTPRATCNLLKTKVALIQCVVQGNLLACFCGCQNSVHQTQC